PMKQPVYKVEDLPQDVPIRLNKYVANTGLCSRREADDYIQAGLITVNGQLITELGSKVLPTDEIRYNGEKLQPERKVYILLNKPKDYVTSVDDPHAKRTVMELIKGACRERIYPVGRLDRMTTGVLLLTNDGELTKKLTHPTSNIRKIYQVHLDKSLKPEDLHGISEGITLDDGFIRIDGISYISDEDKSLVGVEIHSGRNRIVRRVFEHFGYKVTKLDRVYFAGLTKKSLQRGRWRYLDPKEVGFLKMMKA
ncbi:MAG TPA: pseudouridine synthase, partial [Bacteroidales bacterium]